MLNRKVNILSKYKQVLVIMTLVLLAFYGVGSAEAQNSGNLNAGFVLNEMTSDQQISYVGGTIEGLAYSRWLYGGKDNEGFRCVRDWFYGADENRWPLIEAFFDRHREKQVAPLLYILVKKECGE